MPDVENLYAIGCSTSDHPQCSINAAGAGGYLEKQAERHPLIVLVRFAIAQFALGIANARIRHLAAHFLAEHALQRVRRVDPAERVQHILRYVFGVNAIDRIANVLACGDDQRECHQHQHREAVVRPEHQRIDVHVADAHQILQAAEYVEHFCTPLGLGGCARVAVVCGVLFV